MAKHNTWIVVGGQFGSEGKGKISARIVLDKNIKVCVRGGGPNAGHSFQVGGKKVLLRQLPSGVVRPDTRLLIPAGAVIDRRLLEDEMLQNNVWDRVGIDENAVVLVAGDRSAEDGMYDEISSTQTGTGAAMIRRIGRKSPYIIARNWFHKDHPLYGRVTSVHEEVYNAVRDGDGVLIEGTQGAGLSLYHSPYYPKATSRDTSAAAFASEVGIGPTLVSNVVVVFRTFPIRVAGAQAGPLKDEITWETLRVESGTPDSIAEFTTVTKRERRVGRWDQDLADYAVRINAPTSIAVTFLDHLSYMNYGVRKRELLMWGAQEFISKLQDRYGTLVALAGTGPDVDDCIKAY